MSQDTLVEPLPEAKSKLRIFMLYADFPAGIRANHLTRQIGSLAGQYCEIVSEMWKLDSVTPIGPIRNLIAQEAGESDLLLISTSTVDQPDTKLVQWLNSLLDWKAACLMPGLLVGLLGDSRNEVSGQSAIVDQLASFARQARMDFVWRTLGSNLGESGQWIEDDLVQLMHRKKSSYEPLPAI